MEGFLYSYSREKKEKSFAIGNLRCYEEEDDGNYSCKQCSASILMNEHPPCECRDVSPMPMRKVSRAAEPMSSGETTETVLEPMPVSVAQCYQESPGWESGYNVSCETEQ